VFPIYVATERLLAAERAYQKQKWGDKSHTAGEWAAIVAALANRALDRYASTPGDAQARLELLQVATTAVAALDDGLAQEIASDVCGTSGHHLTPQLHGQRLVHYSTAIADLTFDNRQGLWVVDGRSGKRLTQIVTTDQVQGPDRQKIAANLLSIRTGLDDVHRAYRAVFSGVTPGRPFQGVQRLLEDQGQQWLEGIAKIESAHANLEREMKS
jgi:hypothetical protein